MALNHQQDVAEMLENKVCASVVGKRTHFSFPLEFIISLNCLKQHERYILSSSAADCPFSWTSFFSTLQTRRCSVFVVQEIKSNTKRIFYACIPVLKVLVFFLNKNTPNKKQSILAFTKCRICFITLRWCQHELRGRKRQTQAKMNDRKVTKIAVRVFHSAKSIINTVSAHIYMNKQDLSFPDPED